ncbi:MAG: nucleotidyltransferase [Mediterranea massiliensis]|nr:nucleotidyltransferase [Mediterranea massiliensis]
MNSYTINSIIPIIQSYFVTQPISKAWLFGSYSRGEETARSDVDILVSFDKGAKISLFKYADIICQLEALLKQRVDLIEEGTLLPFAQHTANEDKILIYEKSYSTPSPQLM